MESQSRGGDQGPTGRSRETKNPWLMVCVADQAALNPLRQTRGMISAREEIERRTPKYIRGDVQEESSHRIPI